MTALRTAVDLHPQHDELVACLTGFAREQGSATDEIWALRNAVALRPELESLWTRMFTLQMATGEAAAALATTDKLLASNGEHELHLLRRATS